MFVHSSETDKLDLKDIARQFISVNDQRLHYFEKCDFFNVNVNLKKKLLSFNLYVKLPGMYIIYIYI